MVFLLFLMISGVSSDLDSNRAPSRFNEYFPLRLRGGVDLGGFQTATCTEIDSLKERRFDFSQNFTEILLLVSPEVIDNINDLKLIQLKASEVATIQRKEGDILHSKPGANLEDILNKRRKIINGESVPRNQEQTSRSYDPATPMIHSWQWVITPQWFVDNRTTGTFVGWGFRVDRPVTSPGGVPEFWVTAMCRCRPIADRLTPRDLHVLRYLRDIKCVDFHAGGGCGGDEDLGGGVGEVGPEHGRGRGFRLEWDFAENNLLRGPAWPRALESVSASGLCASGGGGGEGGVVLWKAYWEGGPTPIPEAGPMEWAPGCDPCELSPAAHACGGGLGGDAGPARRSFFEFFRPPPLPDEGAAVAERLAHCEDLTEDYQLGRLLRDELLPRAVLWYLGELSS